MRHPLVLFQLGYWFTWFLFIVASNIDSAQFTFQRAALFSLSGFLPTSVAAPLYELTRNHLLLIRLAVFCLLLYLAAMACNAGLQIFLEGVPVESLQTRSIGQWLGGGLEGLWTLIPWAGFYFLTKVVLSQNTQKLALHRAQTETKAAQLETLRYQLNPHFLFNVLNSIDVSVQSNSNDIAHKMIQQLSRFLRNSLQQGEQDKIPLKQELDVINDFIDIARNRFEESISIDMDVEPICKEAMLPPMLLQPLVENAIKFAWTQAEQGRIRLLVRKNKDELDICISNEKVDKSEKLGTGTGLSNTSERLRLVYGNDARIEVSNDQLFSVRILLPWETALE